MKRKHIHENIQNQVCIKIAAHCHGLSAKNSFRANIPLTDKCHWFYDGYTLHLQCHKAKRQTLSDKA